MGSRFSKNPGDNSPPSIQINTDSHYTAELSSYEAACQIDPALQSFDTILQQRTSRAITSLSAGVEVHSLSFDSLREVTGCLLEMNQDVVQLFLDCKEDIWKNQELFELVKEYFENSLITLDFCTVLEKCVKRAHNSQLIIQVALNHFEEEIENGVDGNMYTRTLQELQNFKAAGDPFTEEFFSTFHSVHKQQFSMLQKLRRQRKKLDKKLKSLKVWKTVSNVLFVAAFTSVLIFSVVAAAIAAPPLVTALAGALAVPIGSMGKWINTLWKGYENAIKGQREIVSTMQVGTQIAIMDLDSIRVLVDKLNIEIESLLQNADFALKEPDAVKLVIDEIKKRLNVFVQTLEVLSDHADKCSREVRQARTVVLQRIIKHSNSSSGGSSC